MDNTPGTRITAGVPTGEEGLTTAYIGQPISRVDGRAKVTGGAKDAAEYRVPNLVYGYVVTSAVAKGTIVRIESADALRIPGVLQVLTHENAPHPPPADPDYVEEVRPPGSAFRPLQDNEVKFSGQPVALVVAESFELARYAASLVRIEYDREEHVTDLESMRAQAYVPKRWDMLPPVPKARGNATEAFAKRVRDARRRVSAAGGAPQSDGVIRDDRGLGGRPSHRLRQDTGRAERAGIPGYHARLRQGRTFACSRRSSAERSGWACARSTRCFWRLSRRMC